MPSSVVAMTITETPWEPPLAGTEVEQIVGALERLRTTFRWKADDLDTAGLTTTIGASTLTLGGLLKHLAACEDYKFTVKMRGEPWARRRGPRPAGTAATTGSSSPQPTTRRASLRALGRRRHGARASASARRWPTAGSTRRSTSPTPDGRHANLRRLVCDLIEEYGRHTGHADLIREAVDGRVGEDPPDGWSAASGSFGQGR